MAGMDSSGARDCRQADRRRINRHGHEFGELLTLEAPDIAIACSWIPNGMRADDDPLALAYAGRTPFSRNGGLIFSVKQAVDCGVILLSTQARSAGTSSHSTVDS